VQLKFLALTLGFIVASTGCSHVQRHTLLTIFFEGVPPLESELEGGGLLSASATAKPPRSGADSRSLPPLSIHPPYKERLCEVCHSFNAWSESGTFMLPDVTSGALLAQPVPTLCYGCHPDKAPTPEALAGGWMHGPVAVGACTFCHHPHSSQTVFLLRSRLVREVCQGCHQPGLMHLGEGLPPEDSQNCTGCHTGHRGGTRFLLKSSSITKKPQSASSLGQANPPLALGLPTSAPQLQGLTRHVPTEETAMGLGG
jgi:predicted CXXCH cytochrome family protein